MADHITDAAVCRIMFRANASIRAVCDLARSWPDDAPSNCVLWAMQQRVRHGGAVILMPSQYGPWEHVQYRDPQGQIWEYNPVEEKRQQATLPHLFVGRPVRIPLK